MYNLYLNLGPYHWVPFFLTIFTGENVVISGSGFGNASDEVAVQFDEVVCTVTSATDSELQCTLGAGFAGTKSLLVHILSTGVADSDGVQLSYDLRALSPSPAAGSSVGGTEITITGEGFVSEFTDTPQIPDSSEFAADYVPFSYEGTGTCSEWENVVYVGEYQCEITMETNTEITCLTPPQDISADATYNVTVYVRCLDEGSSDEISVVAGEFTYDTSSTPVLTGIEPENGTVIGGENVTIFGSGFSTTPVDNIVKVCSHIYSNSISLW